MLPNCNLTQVCKHDVKRLEGELNKGKLEINKLLSEQVHTKKLMEKIMEDLQEKFLTEREKMAGAAGGLEKGQKEVMEQKDNEIKKLTERVENLQSEVRKIKSDKDVAEAEKAKAEKEVEALKKEVSNTKVEVETLKKDAESQRTKPSTPSAVSIQVPGSVSGSRRSSATPADAANLAKIAELEKKIKELNDQIRVFKNELSDKQKEFTQEKADLQLVIDQMKAGGDQVRIY